MTSKPSPSSPTVGTIDWKVGDYAIHHGGVVRIENLANPTTIELVAYYDKGVGICCGGGSMMGGDRRSELKPVTLARDLLIVKAYASQLVVKEAQALLAREAHTVEICTAALKALDEASALSNGEHSRGGE